MRKANIHKKFVIVASASLVFGTFALCGAQEAYARGFVSAGLGTQARSELVQKNDMNTYGADAQGEHKAGDGKCGSGKCSGNKAGNKKEGEEASSGSVSSEGHEKKAGEGKCGQGKCGGSKK